MCVFYRHTICDNLLKINDLFMKNSQKRKECGILACSDICVLIKHIIKYSHVWHVDILKIVY